MAAYKIIAWAMVNPAKAAKMLEVARAIARSLPYAASVGVNVSKPMHDKVDDFIRESGEKLSPSPTPVAASGPQSSVTASPRELLEKAKQLNSPAAQGRTAYNHIAVNPATGHQIGSQDGKTWYDVASGQKIAA